MRRGPRGEDLFLLILGMKTHSFGGRNGVIDMDFSRMCVDGGERILAKRNKLKLKKDQEYF